MELKIGTESWLGMTLEAKMLRPTVKSYELSNICFDCFSMTRTAAIKQIIGASPSDYDNVLLQCSELCRRTAQALTMGHRVSPDVLHACAEACALSADYCEARDMDACAIACWETAAAIADEMLGQAPDMMLAAE
ncbi:hypothetical protein [Phreatobacter stygius]|uniref:Four-helix bundle copper-binding protein n=1 Tax=Phreatobacter stygius TaxID=1940610 RepID=A0A4D7BM76_9HYPH|nr:hypothetical protein [Phreatobacter stygius]QCI68837.1 hypothetical protein E8M01_34170 [Phreatobacter stygius]